MSLSSALYADDIETFVTRLAHALRVNLSVFHYYLMENEDDDKSWQEEHIYDFGYTNSCKLTVDRNHPSDKFYYDVNLPVDFPNEKELCIQFYENGIIEFLFLTYDHTWYWFMDRLYQACVSKQEDTSILNDILQTKILIEQLLRQLGLDRIIYYGNYPYAFNNQLIDETPRVSSFQQIIEKVASLDKLAIIDFDSLLTGELISDFPYEWLGSKPNKVVLLHQIGQCSRSKLFTR